MLLFRMALTTQPGVPPYEQVLPEVWKIKKKDSGSGALSGKMLFLRIDLNNKIDYYFRAG